MLIMYILLAVKLSQSSKKKLQVDCLNGIDKLLLIE
jgi:hypothetical protein